MLTKKCVPVCISQSYNGHLQTKDIIHLLFPKLFFFFFFSTQIIGFVGTETSGSHLQWGKMWAGDALPAKSSMDEVENFWVQ